jgi:hypothetical protein
MNVKQTFAFSSFLATTLLAASSIPAQAFSFTTNLEPGYTAKGDVWLDSVTLGDGTVIDEFSLVNQVQILHNDAYTGGNSGAASADRGDNTTTGVNVEDPTGAHLVTNLNNLNLNNIVDGEDRGSFRMNFFFDSLVSRVFLWERGRNSQLGVQAIDAKGNLLGQFLHLNSRTWNYAGFNIDTKEIDGAQQVGSLGLDLADFGVLGPIAGIQVSALSSYNGPDFKVVAAQADPEAVPEPMTLLGTGIAAGAMAWSRRRKNAQEK